MCDVRQGCAAAWRDLHHRQAKAAPAPQPVPLTASHVPQAGAMNVAASRRMHTSFGIRNSDGHPADGLSPFLSYQHGNLQYCC